MRIADYHLTYCTNIHPGESWEATFSNLKEHLPLIKEQVSGKQAFGIGLRISDEASRELMEPGKLGELKQWLKTHDCYVFTLNGFPFGGFHRQVVKDEVHHPDWTTKARLDYTIRLADILSAIMPMHMDAGISTSPLSYKHWHKEAEALEQVKAESCKHLLQVVEHLHSIKKETGQELHLDIEPEPDGVLENAEGLIRFFKEWLLPQGIDWFQSRHGLSEADARELVLNHLQVCYDVCHFAVAYEDHAVVLNAFREAGIKIGKFQLSAALKISIPEEMTERKAVERSLLPFVESTYLHQVIGVARNGAQKAYPDLPDALLNLAETTEIEWRIHFHVPVFLSGYGTLQSTQEDILKVLKLNEEGDYSRQLEVETYTWEVLPEDIHLSLDQSIVRELDWVKNQIK